MVCTPERLRLRSTVYALIIACAALMLVATVIKCSNDRSSAIASYRETSAAETSKLAKDLSFTLRGIYQGIRTIAILPGVIAIDPHGSNLNPDTATSINAIYKNIQNNAAVSEVYIVPKDMQPEQIDPATRSFWVPARMFDGTNPEGVGSANPTELTTTVEQAEHAKQVEIYEYRLIRQQMDELNRRYPTRASIQGMAFPLAGGHEVLTCDNSVFDNTKDDIDRTGIVFSVPFYDKSGNFAGVVSAVIRINVVRSYLPDARYALVSTPYRVALTSLNASAETQQNAHMLKSEPDPAYLYSGTAAVETADPDANWVVWAAYPDAEFLNSAQAGVICKTAYRDGAPA